MIKPKDCPICGSMPLLEVRDLGRGYPGEKAYIYSCPKCDLPIHKGSDTLSGRDNYGVYAIKEWNQEVKRIENFMKNKER